MKNDEIIELSKVHYNGMPEFKAKHFVGNAQITPYAKVKQYLTEIENRQLMVEQNVYEKKKLELEILLDRENKSKTSNKIEKQLIDLEIEKKQNNIISFEKLIRRATEERDMYVNLIKDICDSPDGKYRDGRTLLEIMNEPEICEELEKEYWTYRMAKQTAMDMIAYGRAGLGNMDSVFMLEGEQQRDIMKLACDLFVKNEKRTQHFLQNANSSEPQKLSLSKTLELDM